MNQEIRECGYGWDEESCRCRGFGQRIETMALVNPDLCRKCYCAQEEEICERYDGEINECREKIWYINHYKECARNDGGDVSSITLNLTQAEKSLKALKEELKEGKRRALKTFRDSQGVWVSLLLLTFL